MSPAGGVPDALGVGGQQHRRQRAGAGRQAVPHTGGVLLDGGEQPRRAGDGGQAAGADGGGQLVEAGVGGTQGSAGGSAAEQAIHNRER